MSLCSCAVTMMNECEIHGKYAIRTFIEGLQAEIDTLKQNIAIHEDIHKCHEDMAKSYEALFAERNALRDAIRKVVALRNEGPGSRPVMHAAITEAAIAVENLRVTPL